MNRPSRSGIVFVLAILGLFLACGGGTEPGGNDPVPSSATKQAGDGQTATVASLVPLAPSVLVKDQNGAPMAGVQVAFTATAGSGNVGGSPATTGNDGVATVTSWTLGTTAGAQSLNATVVGLSGVTLTFAATAVAGPAAAIALSSGNNQSAVVGTNVPLPPTVLVADAHGNPVQGVTVTFAVTGGTGSLVGNTPASGADGKAAVTSWQLGALTGPNTLSATAAGLTGSPVGFTATALAGPAASIAINAGNGQTAAAGTNVAVAPSVIVKDANDNPVPGVPVAFAVTGGAGAVGLPLVNTDASGVASAQSWRMGNLAGPNTMTATSGTLAGSPVQFTGTGVAGPAAALTVETGDGQTGAVGTTLPIAPAVKVTDAFGNPVAGTQVVFSPAPGSGSVTGGTPTSTAAGIATVGSWTLGATVGSQVLSATVASVPGVQVDFTATVTGKTWTGAVSTDWSAGANWSPQGAPVGTDTVYVPAATRAPILTGNSTVAGVHLSGDSLVIAGHMLTITGDLEVTGSGVLVMTNPLDQVTVGRHVGFGGGDETGRLSAGVLTVGGDFTQTGSSHAFVASSQHQTILNGSQQQNVTFGSPGFANSHFNNLELSGAAPVFANYLSISGRLDITTPIEVGHGTLNVLGRISTAPGSTLIPIYGFVNADSLSIGGTYAIGQTFITGGSVLPDLPYSDLTITTSGTILVSGGLALNNLEVTAGDLVLNGHTVSASSVMIRGATALLTMTNPLDSLTTTGFSTEGADATGHFTAGVLTIQGGFFQYPTHSTRSFVGSGSHRVRFNGGQVHFVVFNSLGLSGSYFHDIELAAVGTEVMIDSIIGTGSLIVTAGGTPMLTGGRLTVAGLNVSGLVLNNAKVISDGGVISQFDNVTLQNYPDDVVQLTIRHPGTGGTSTFNNLTFSSTPVTGLYIDAVDTDGLAPGLSILINSNLSNAQGTAFTRTNTGPGPVQAQVTWP